MARATGGCGMTGLHGAAKYRAKPHLRCRCDVCTEAHSARVAAEKVERAQRLAADPTLAEHGKADTYQNWRCRCVPCVEAHSQRCHDYKVRTGRATGKTFNKRTRGES